MTATLDLERFAKVRALMSGGSTAGERLAAKTRAEAMARAAGLTFGKACAKADAAKVKLSPASTAPLSYPTSAGDAVDALNAFFNRPEFVAERAERETKRQARCRELLAEYANEEAVFADTPREAALRAAVDPFRAAIEEWGVLGTAKNLPPDIRRAVTTGWPLPATVTDAWAEFHAADRLSDHRCAFEPGYDDWEFVRARGYVLEHLLDTLPASSFPDVLARVSWLEHINGQGFSRDVHEDEVLLVTLRADVERLALNAGNPGNASVQCGQAGLDVPEREIASPVQTGHGTTAGRRGAVLSMLDTSGLTDREIARRVGVSPSTVGNLRRKAAGVRP